MEERAVVILRWASLLFLVAAVVLIVAGLWCEA
jgi:hypothetical protein